jgi:hypothetical protein
MPTPLSLEAAMKRGLLAIPIIMVALLCMGMGGLGGQPEGSVPETDVRIQAEVQDRSGTSITLNQFSMDGKTYLVAWQGQGKLTIPFQHIDTITFEEAKGESVVTAVKLKSGNVMTLKIRSRARFYGSTGYGAYQIGSRDVYSIDFP